MPPSSRISEGSAERALLGDVTDDPASLDAMLRDGPVSVDHVILCVAPSRARGDSHESLYPAAARGAMHLARRLEARTLTYTSSTAVYGVEDGSVVREESPVSTHDVRGRALAEAERAILEDAGDAIANRIVLRVAGLYGPGRDPASRFRDGPLTGAEGERWCNFAWRDDVCAAVLRLQDTMQTSAGAQIFNCADGAPLQARDITRWLRDASDAALDPSVPDSRQRDAGRATRSNQRVAVDRLRATGWMPSVTNVLQGLTLLGHGAAS
jgi:nucleoside-diphosphate-sugar epimerase